MTLMEVLMAHRRLRSCCSATLGLLDSTVRLNTGVMAKTDAMQRGRLAMDVITQQLRSQVCLENLAGPAIVPGATNATRSTFYSDFSEGDGTVPPTKRTLTFDPATGDDHDGDLHDAPCCEPRPGDFPARPRDTQLRARERRAAEGRAAATRSRSCATTPTSWVGNPARPEATLELRAADRRQRGRAAWRASTSRFWRARPAPTTGPRA